MCNNVKIAFHVRQCKDCLSYKAINGLPIRPAMYSMPSRPAIYSLPTRPTMYSLPTILGNVLIAYQAGYVLIAYLAAWADGAMSFSPCGAYVGQRHSRKDKEPAQVENWLRPPRFWGCLLVVDNPVFGDVRRLFSPKFLRCSAVILRSCSGRCCLMGAWSCVFYHLYLVEQSSPCMPKSLASLTACITRLYLSSKGKMSAISLCILYHILAAVR